MLTSIDSHIRRRRVVLLAVLILAALGLGMVVALTADGHIHLGGSTLVAVDASAVNQIVGTMLLLVGLIAMPSLVRIIRARGAVVDDPPTAPPGPPARLRVPAPPCLMTLCRIQV